MATPLTVEVLTKGTIQVMYAKDGMQYSTDGGATKTALPSGTIVLNGGNDFNVGDKVEFYGDGTSITSYTYTQISGGTAKVKVYGNIMSLVDEENFATNTMLPTGCSFMLLFMGNTTLTDASGLLLPAEKLVNVCYQQMFDGCTSLTTAYVKAAYTTTGDACEDMFNGCTNATGRTFYSKDAATADTWRSTFGLSNWASGVYPTE